VERGFFEVSVENGGAQDGGQIEKHELCRYNDLMDAQWISDGSSSADYLAIKPHQGTIQVSYLANSGAKEDLEAMVFMGGLYIAGAINQTYGNDWISDPLGEYFYPFHCEKCRQRFGR